MKISIINNREIEVEESKLFGEAYLPEKWLEDDTFSPYEFFLCQLRLEDFNSDNLPKSGYLYFFIEDYGFSGKKLKARVRYFDSEPDAYTDFNDGYFEYDPESVALKVESLGELNFDFELNNQVCLLEIPCELLPLDLECDKIAFVIEKADLANGDFSKTSLIFIN